MLVRKQHIHLYVHVPYLGVLIAQINFLHHKNAPYPNPVSLLMFYVFIYNLCILIHFTKGHN